MHFQKPIWWSHDDPCARCHLFVCSRTSLRAWSPILCLKAPLRAQLLWCNKSRMCRFVIVLVWRGESRALGVMDTVMAIKLQPEEPSDPPRDGSASTPAMLSVCISLILYHHSCFCCCVLKPKSQSQRSLCHGRQL